MTETRPCERCGKVFARNKKYSQAQWDGARWCSRRCGSWNLGLTKADDPRLANIAECVRVAATGRPSWSKGLTKADHPSLAIVSRKVSIAQKGRSATETQLKSLKIGQQWRKGRTKEDTPSIAIQVAKLSAILKGRKNPKHSAHMRKYYSENPQKHPNAIIAKKTKGKGFTALERTVAGHLRRLGIEFEFNGKVGSKWPDFVIRDRKLIFEADGDRWHKDIEHERRRDTYLETFGFKVIHLSESTIKNPVVCLSAILGAIYG